MNTPIIFELAKLLKEKDFDIPVIYFYKNDGTKKSFKDKSNINFNYFHRNSTNAPTSAPTIAEVVMWLHDKHGIWIAPKKVMGMNKWFPQIYKGDDLIISEIITNSPTEAYLGAIDYTLKNLI